MLASDLKSHNKFDCLQVNYPRNVNFSRSQTIFYMTSQAPLANVYYIYIHNTINCYFYLDNDVRNIETPGHSNFNVNVYSLFISFFLAFMAFTSYFCRSSNKIQLLKWYLTKGFILNAWTTNVNTFGIVYVQQNKALTEALFMLCGLLNVDNCTSAIS